MTLLNRTLPRAEALAADFPEVQFDIRLMPDLMPCVEAADVVFVASGSEAILIHGSDISSMQVRGFTSSAAALIQEGASIPSTFGSPHPT